MKTIPLSRGMVAIVDDADYDWLSQWKWSAKQQGRPGCAVPKWRAVRTVVEDGRQRCVYMHRVIAGTDAGEITDHRDGDTLNNRRGNLRTTTQARNMLNRVANHRRKLAGGKGVYWHKGARKWMAMFRDRYLGLFHEQHDAERAYDDAARKHDPEFALTNAMMKGAA